MGAAEQAVGAVAQVGRLRAACFRVTLVAEDPLTVPPYKGSALRGGFGAAFKKLCCVLPERRYCSGCNLHQACPYGIIFETAPPEGATHTAKYRDVPRPFVIIAPPGGRTWYEAGEHIEFGVNVFGQAANFGAYFMLAFEEFGRCGLGRGRGRFRVERVTAFPPRPLLTGEGAVGVSGGRAETVVYGGAPKGVFRPWPGHLLHKPLCTALAHWRAFATVRAVGTGCAGGAKAESHTLHVRFLTPTRVTWQGDLLTRPVFHVLFRNCLRRISSLAYFHHGYELDVDFGGLIRRAEQVHLVRDRTYWVDWERYSSRQEERMRLGGFVGDADFSAAPEVWEAVLPFVLPAPVLHVGKNTTFGLGRVQLALGRL